MQEFTKGKWEYVEYIPEGITLNGKEYLIMSGGEDVALALRENDARLIAAAPEMYHMLSKILDDTQNGQFADENGIIALLNRIDGEKVKGDEHIALS